MYVHIHVGLRISEQKYPLSPLGVVIEPAVDTTAHYPGVKTRPKKRPKYYGFFSIFTLSDIILTQSIVPLVSVTKFIT